jgi:hypothetical protein
MPDALARIRQRTWDLWLTIATVVLLASLGVQSFLGTAYSWWAHRSIQFWEQTSYAAYVHTMNTIAAPQVVALVVVMGLCVPKRLFSRLSLIAVSALMLLAGALAWAATSSVTLGLGVYLVMAALIQVAVVVLTVAGASSPSYLTEGRLTKIGSGLLHLGFIGICLVVIALQHSRFTLPAFWLAASAVVVGTTLSFWAGRFAYRRRSSPYAEETLADDALLEAEDSSSETTGTLETPSALEVADHRGDEGGSEFDQLG